MDGFQPQGGLRPPGDGLNRPRPGGRNFFYGGARASGWQLPETARGISFGSHAFFCNFLLTKPLPQFNMAVDKTGDQKEVRGKATVIQWLGENGKEKLVTTFLN
jgi:hypothetical protein